MKRILASNRAKVLLGVISVAFLTAISWAVMAGSNTAYFRILDICLAFNLSLLAEAGMVGGALLPAYLVGRSNKPLIERGFLWGFLTANGLLAFTLIWLRVIFEDSAEDILAAYPAQIIPLAVLMAIFFGATATLLGRLEARKK